MLRLSTSVNRALLAAVLSVAALSNAGANEQTLIIAPGAADTYEYLDQDAHFIKYLLPEGWKAGFGEEIQFYGQRYGDVKGLKGTAVVWGPAVPAKLGSRARELGAMKIFFTEQFDLSSVPEKAGWYSLPIDPVTLPSVFAISIYTSSNEQRGVKLGLTAKGTRKSQSTSTRPTQTGAAAPVKFRRDGRDWLIRFKIRDTLNPPSAKSAAELCGANYLCFDDGTAEDFVTVQKLGFLLRCETPGPATISSIFVYGKLDGNWLGSKRTVSVHVLDKDLKLLSRTSIPYNIFTNVPSWGEAHFSPVRVGPLHYVCIEPTSRPNEQFLLGYDTGSGNKASGFGTIGAELAWPFATPAQDKANWMIRVKYAP
jgi:hypothetical protein